MLGTRRWVLSAVVIALLAACSSSSSSSPPSQSPTGAVAMITQNWEAFFSGKTSAGQKTKLLQNGRKFGALIQAQAGSGLAQSTEARVHSVIVRGSAATIRYDILIGGHPALTNQTGT